MPQSIQEFLQKGIATSKEIQTATQLNQTAVARQLKSMTDSIVKIKEGRTPKYALTRNAFGCDDKLPLMMIDVHGNARLTATIRPLAHGGFFVESVTGTPPILLGEKGNGLYDDLPFFLSDLAPQGFLGRQIATEISSNMDSFPSDPRYWNTNHIGLYLVTNGDDLPGNFKLGHQAHLGIRRQPEASTDSDYPSLAENVLKGAVPGSSAGGEQPKFTAFHQDLSAHVIVKFSPQGNTETSRRWRDILITEHHATEILHDRELPAAETRLIENDNRLFLESRRFDRSGQYGRSSLVSLSTIDAEFTGLGDTWPQVITALNQKNLVSDDDVIFVKYLWYFGRLINNTDMHLGNLSFSIDGGVFRLLPAYDMCSMGFAPKSHGETTAYRFTPKVPQGLNLGDEIENALHAMARDFWIRVSQDERISDEFKRYLRNGNPINETQ